LRKMSSMKNERYWTLVSSNIKIVKIIIWKQMSSKSDILTIMPKCMK